MFLVTGNGTAEEISVEGACDAELEPYYSNEQAGHVYFACPDAQTPQDRFRARGGIFRRNEPLGEVK
jgi:hypothetical protein